MESNESKDTLLSKEVGKHTLLDALSNKQFVHVSGIAIYIIEYTWM